MTVLTILNFFLPASPQKCGKMQIFKSPSEAWNLPWFSDIAQYVPRSLFQAIFGQNRVRIFVLAIKSSTNGGFSVYISNIYYNLLIDMDNR